MVRLVLGALVVSFAMPAVDMVYRKGADAFAVADVRRAEMAMLAYVAEHDTAAGVTLADLRAIEPQLPAEDRMGLRVDGASYALTVVSDRRGAEQAAFTVYGDGRGSLRRECHDGGLDDSGLCSAGAW